MAKARAAARFLGRVANAGGVAADTLNSTGVTAGTYGTGFTVPQITVDTDGRVTAAADKNITFDIANLTGNLAARIDSVVITDSIYTDTNDTAISNTGGYIKLRGANFDTGGSTLLVGTTSALSVTVVSATEIRARIGPLANGTYTLYLSGLTTGSLAILLNGLVVSPVPVWQTSSTLATVNSGIAINLQLAATDATIYTLAPGSSLPTGLTLSQTGLLSGTLFVAATTTYAFTIIATDAQFQDTPQMFTVTVSAIDLYSRELVLHITGNSVFTPVTFDESPYAWHERCIINPSTTNNRHPMAKRITPFLTNYCLELYGNRSAYIEYPTTTRFDLPATFTIEFWMYTHYYQLGSNANSNDKIIIQRCNSSASVGWELGINSNATIYFYDRLAAVVHYFNWNNPPQFTQGGYVRVHPGEWHHLAIVRENTASGGFKFYVDGQLKRASSCSSFWTNADPIVIGRHRDMSGQPNSYFHGRLFNLRISDIARYTSNFTPTSLPYTYDSYTRFLTGHRDDVFDNNLLTLEQGISITGSTLASYPAITNRGPAYEAPATDGSFYTETHRVEIVDITGNATLKLDANSWCIDGWVYRQSETTGTLGIIGKGTGTVGAAGSGWTVASGSTQELIFYYAATSVSSATYALPWNQWNHFAVSKEYISGANAQLRLFVNGRIVSNTTIANSSLTFTGDDLLRLGSHRDSAGEFDGHIYDLRISKNTPRYTNNFAIPTTKTVVDSNTVLSIFRNPGQVREVIIDESPRQYHLTFQNADVRNWEAGAFSRSTGYSMFFYGGDETIEFADSSNFDFGWGTPNGGVNFTIDIFFLDHRNRDDTTQCWLYRFQQTNTENDGYYLWTNIESGVHYVNFGIGDRDGWLAQSVRFGGRYNKFTWNWVVVQRIGNSTAFYLNGVKTAEINSPLNINATRGPIFGESWYGNLSNFRMQRGQAYYAVDGANPSTISWPTPDPTTGGLPTNMFTILFAFGYSYHTAGWNTSNDAYNDTYMISFGPFFDTVGVTGDNGRSSGIGWSGYDTGDSVQLTRSENKFPFLHQHGTSWTVEGYVWPHLNSVYNSWQNADGATHHGIKFVTNNDAGTINRRGNYFFSIQDGSRYWSPGTATQNAVVPHGFNHFAVCFDINPAGTGPKYASWGNGTRYTHNDYVYAGFSPASSQTFRFGWNPASWFRITRRAIYNVNNTSLALRGGGQMYLPMLTAKFGTLDGTPLTMARVPDSELEAFWTGTDFPWKNESMGGLRFRYGNIIPSTRYKRPGFTHSMYFPGRINTTGSANEKSSIQFYRNSWRDGAFRLRYENFTFEAWVSVDAATAVSAANQCIFDIQDYVRLSITSIGTWGLLQTTTERITGFTPVALNGTFQYVVLTRESLTYKLYVNNVLQGSFASDNVAVSGNYDLFDEHGNPAAYLCIGNRWSNTTGTQFNGWMNDVKLTKYYSRYTTPYNSPGAPMYYFGTTTPVIIDGFAPNWITANSSIAYSQVGSNFSSNIQAVGNPTITYSLSSGSLPPGLTLNSSTGVISGTAGNLTQASYTVTFVASNSFGNSNALTYTILNQPTPVSSFTVEYFMVAGGGGGGSDGGSGTSITAAGGGGGAGGIQNNVVNLVVGTTYFITVGSGGLGSTQQGVSALPVGGSNGSNSSIFDANLTVNISATGGGAGGYFAYQVMSGNALVNISTAGSNGGSGGGAAGSETIFQNGLTRSGGTPIQGQGFAGGNNWGQTNSGGGGGGGGAGGIGTSAPSAGTGGGGGIGFYNSTYERWGTNSSNTINPGGTTGPWTTTGYGYFGGGGGGGPAASGNYGGGGAASGVRGTDGLAATGGGGGGGKNGGNGGSGIVFIRYFGSQRADGGNVTSISGYTIHSFVTSGTFRAY